MNGDINYDSPGNGTRTLARLNLSGMSGQPAVGFYRWSIQFDAALYVASEPNSPKIVFTDIKGDLQTSQGNLLLARFFQTEPRNHDVGYFSGGHDSFTLEAELDARRMPAIEELRNGRDLHLEMKLWAVAVDTANRNRYPANGRAGLNLTQSDWQRVREQMQYHKTMLLEVPVPDETTDPLLADASKHLATASSQLARGHYRGCVAECRDALSTLVDILGEQGDVPEEIRQWLKRDDTLTKEQRTARVNAMLVKLTHLAHHTDETAKRTEWRPMDARAILMMTGSLLQLASKDGE